MCAARDADAVLKHRYSFTSNANDSVGGMHGTVVDVGTATNFNFTGGQIDLSANAGQGSNAITEDAYVDLPNGLVSAAFNSGTVGAASFELWATVTTQRTWQRFFDFGTSNDGEDTSASGSNTDYFYIAPNSGRFSNGLATEVHSATDPLNEVGQTGPFPLGVEKHVVGVYSHADTSLGPNGSFYLYLDGVLVDSQALNATPDLRTLPDNNNWLGRSQWNDPVFDGSFNEFRIYDHALSSGEVAFNGALGPDQAATLPPGGSLALEVNTVTGNVRLKSNVTVPLNVNYYEVTSAMGALSTTGWSSLDDQEGGDPPGQGWDESGGVTANQLIELFLAEAGDVINAGEVLNLGSAFNPSVFGSGVNGDLMFRFGTTNGALVSGGVAYVTTTAGVMGDYNDNGTVDAADYVLWRNNGPLQNEGVTPGTVTDEDYTFWRSRFGATSGSASGVAAVPEPGVAWFGALLALAALLRRRHKSITT
jgi:hypothetical protein